jgi:polyferredoxin
MFNQFIGWLGIFRLRVKDRYECVNCKSKACATVCPVGLTSMPGQFIAAGEFKNYKCIGVGQCVSACPVENIFFYDARQWFRERMGKSKPQTQPGTLFVAPRGGNKE